MRNRKRKRIGFGPRQIIFCLFAAVFVAGAVLYGNVQLSHRRAESSIKSLQTRVDTNRADTSDGLVTEAVGASLAGSAPAENPVDFAALREINSDICGWLYAEGTRLDYPLLHTDNNEYYLDHLYDGEKNDYGSLFLDFRNSDDFTDRNTVIYGHHMRNGSMFGLLEEYKSQAFYEAFPTMVLHTPGGSYRIELICGTEESGNEEFVRFRFDSEEDFMQYVAAFRERSTFQSDVTLEPGDRIISLCTCSYKNQNARYMLIGRLGKY